MGTKNNPGAFDCHESAEDDEPLFTLRARDPHAPALVRLWADLRELRPDNPSKVDEARHCADAMERYRHASKCDPLCVDLVMFGNTSRVHVEACPNDDDWS